MLRCASNPHDQLGANAGIMPPLVIVADDLTGACDSAAAFLSCADTVRVFLRDATPRPDAGAVLACTTESRNLRAAEASTRVEHAIRRMTEGEFTRPLIFKKIDSGARGHIGAEVLSALSISGARLALVAPSFPQAGRVVSNGTIIVRDVAQQHTKIDLRSLFPASHRDWLQVLAAGQVPELRHSIRKAVENGTRILLCDSETQQDLERIASAASVIDEPILWAGSAGLAHAIASLFPPVEAPQTARPDRRAGRTLCFVGTRHPVTELQLAHLRLEPAATPYEIHEVDWDEKAAANVRLAFQRGPVAALILTGGDTAAFVLSVLRANSIRLAGQIAPGVPWGYIEGGDADGCMVITKSGGFGQQDTLLQSFNFCSGRICEPA